MQETLYVYPHKASEFFICVYLLTEWKKWHMSHYFLMPIFWESENKTYGLWWKENLRTWRESSPDTSHRSALN